MVTLCTASNRPVLGVVQDGVMEVNSFGRCVTDAWVLLPDSFRGIALDACAVLPSHVHGIVTLRGGGPSLGAVVRTWKAEAAQAARAIGYPAKEAFWMNRYSEQRLHNEQELWETRSYLWNNARNWSIPLQVASVSSPDAEVLVAGR